MRPFLLPFLKKLSKYYEIVVFTASTKNYAYSIISQIDPQRQFIDYLLCRQHCTQIDSALIKDLDRIGRDIGSIIIIDNDKHSFQLHT